MLRLSVGGGVFKAEHVKEKERCFYVCLVMCFSPNNLEFKLLDNK